MEIVKVYIVEDDPMVASINRQFTERVVPFKVIGSSASETEALEKIREIKPDLVLLDIILFNGNGLNLLRQIRKENIPTDIIFVTAAKDPGTIREAFRYGAIDYIIKPFNFERLKQALLITLNLEKLFRERNEISQEELDEYPRFANLRGLNNLSSLPKGVHYLTLKQLLDYLDKQKDSLSCQQIASNLTLSKITTWRYLEYLVTKGKVKVTLEYGVIGRPTKYYCITRKDC